MNIEALSAHDVDFVISGAVALLHGSSRVTRELDICYAREPPVHARVATLQAGLNFTLGTADQASDEAVDRLRTRAWTG